VDITDSRSGAGLAARRRSARLLLALAGVATLAVSGCSANTSAKPAAAASYGTLPSFLPTSAIQPDSILTGTADRPALTTEGDSVKVQLPSGSVLVTVAGPEVPGEGLPYQASATTCTWTVTMTGATVPVPITTADFTTIDHLGTVYHSGFVAGQTKPPAMLKPGRTTTFELRAVMTVGEGLMRWAPDGRTIVASWDFEVEND
jgi:hypothetical protein